MAWVRPLLLTLELMVFSSVLAAVLGIAIAWLTSVSGRSTVRGRFVFAFFFVSAISCLATPLVLHAASWESAAGKFGWLSFTQTSARTYTGLGGRYSGMVASVWIHGLFGSALVALATWFATHRIPETVLDQARMEMGWQKTWWRVQLPLAMPWITASLLASSMLAATEMTVVDLYGVRTLADEFYLFHAIEPSVLSVLSTLVVPVVVVIGLLWGWASAQKRVNVDWAGRSSTDPASASSGILSWLASIVAVFLASIWVAFPLLAMVIKTGHQMTPAIEPNGESVFSWSFSQTLATLGRAPAEFAQEYQWSFVLAIATGCCAMVIAWLLGAVARTNIRARTLFDFCSVVMFMIPGPVVGIAVIYFFSMPIPGFRSIYQGSLIPAILGLSMRAVPVGYWVMRAAYQGVPSEVIDTARIDLSWPQRFVRVDFAIMKRYLVVAFFAAAVMASGDVPVTLPVLPPGVVTVGTRLFALLHSGARHQEASLGFWYVLSILVAAGSIALCWKRSLR